MSRKKKTEAPAPVDPFDHTVIMPGVPELPQEATQILPLNQPRPDFMAEATPAPEKPVPVLVPASAPARPRRGVFISLWIGAVALLTAGMCWWLLGTSAPAPGKREPVAAATPSSLQGYLDAAQKGDPKAMRMLGACYTYGLGVRPDPAQGRAWYQKAADAGDAAAAKELQASGSR